MEKIEIEFVHNGVIVSEDSEKLVFCDADKFGCYMSELFEKKLTIDVFSAHDLYPGYWANLDEKYAYIATSFHGHIVAFNEIPAPGNATWIPSDEYKVLAETGIVCDNWKKTLCTRPDE